MFQPSWRIRRYMLRSRFSTVGCVYHTRGFAASSGFASLLFLSAAESENAKQNRAAMTTNNRFFDCILSISLQNGKRRLAECLGNGKAQIENGGRQQGFVRWIEQSPVIALTLLKHNSRQLWCGMTESQRLTLSLVLALASHNQAAGPGQIDAAYLGKSCAFHPPGIFGLAITRARFGRYQHVQRK